MPKLILQICKIGGLLEWVDSIKWIWKIIYGPILQLTLKEFFLIFLLILDMKCGESLKWPATFEVTSFDLENMFIIYLFIYFLENNDDKLLKNILSVFDKNSC